MKTSHLKVKKDGSQAYCEEVHTCVSHNVHPDAFKQRRAQNDQAKVQVEGMLRHRRRKRKNPETYIAVQRLNLLDAPAPAPAPAEEQPSQNSAAALKKPPHSTTRKVLPLTLPEEELSANPRRYLPKEEAAKRLSEIQHQAERAKHHKKNQLPNVEKQPAPVPLGQVLQQTIYREKSGD